jgi:MFS family permease
MLILLAVSGVFTCYQVAANASFVQATPASQRSQAFGIAQGGISLGQGISIIIAGAAAEHATPSLVIAAAGGIGVLCAAVLTLTTARAERRPAGQPALSGPRHVNRHREHQVKLHKHYWTVTEKAVRYSPLCASERTATAFRPSRQKEACNAPYYLRLSVSLQHALAGYRRREACHAHYLLVLSVSL